MWGQAAAEPLALTRALMQQRDRLGPLEVFIGASWSDCADPVFADGVRLRSYCGAGLNRRLAQAGVLRISPRSCLQAPSPVSSRPVRDVLTLLSVAPSVPQA